MVVDVLSILASQRQAAAEALSATAGGLNLCAVSRSGTPYPAVKYHEGAVSALAEAMRALRENASDDAVSQALTGVRARWQARASTPVAQTPDWRAYYAGGIEALDAILDRLRG